MNTFKEPVLKNKVVQKAIKRKEPISLYGLTRSVRPLVQECIRDDKLFSVIITYDDNRADKLYQEYHFFDKNCYIYPAKDVLFYYADIHGNVTQRKRLEIVQRIIEKKRSVIILTVDGLMDRIPKIDEVRSNIITLKKNTSIDLKELLAKLSDRGYENMGLVEAPGQFSLRGGIFDIFPLTEECPYRVELWGDEIDSIRSFDVETQRSIEEVEMVRIFPAGEFVLTEDRIRKGIGKIDAEYTVQSKILKESFRTEQYARLKKATEGIKEQLIDFNSTAGIDSYVTYFYDETVSFLDYLPEDETSIFIDEPDEVGDRAAGYFAEFTVSMEGRLEGGYILPQQADILFDNKSTEARIMQRNPVMMSEFTPIGRYFRTKELGFFDSHPVKSFENRVDALIDGIEKWRSEQYKVVVVIPSHTRAKRLADEINRNDIIAFYSDAREHVLLPKEVMITAGGLETGFILPGEKLVCVSENDIFTRNSAVSHKKRRPKFGNGEGISDLAELHVGDYVVHERHGIGIYRGIEKVETEGTLRDYINIDYADGGKLFIPVDQFRMIGKYADKDAAKPKLNKLGGTDWEKTRSRVRKHVDDIAKELIELYAARSTKKGHSYAEDSIWQREFEELFPYEETQDQLRAINDTKQDMESPRIMDRLICGDVGFGKTEIAIRAAFKAVQDNKQVAYLVPTTILAEQHYENIKSRMKDYPISVEMLSRFRTPKQIKDTLDGLKKGSVDIVIGTHRLLSKDVIYKDLGLLIIDEEQRFGVKHKEKIKQLRNTVDVLTLTATPIPRTLHMSLIGVRDMSLLEEAPVDRRPIQTYVMAYDKEIVKEAIKRELARNGQVYYVYNRVDDIDSIAADLRALIPGAVIEYAHGKMQERKLESIMKDFVEKKIDVLVSTTIIETGLDIPNVNTIMIHNADRFGLSQLYQLRGRVGRSDRSAYAFLMYQKDRMIREVAEKRLAAIKEFTDLGSGYKIAMKDLEIRGAGDVLGSSQSGHMAEVGYDLYVKMLSTAIKAGMGDEEQEEEFDTTIDLPVDAYIPDSYAKTEFLKLDLYRKISRIEDHEDVERIEEEMKDRFGEPPIEVARLVKVSEVRKMANRAYITDVRYQENGVFFAIFNNAPLNVDRIPDFIRRKGGDVRLVTAKQSGFFVKMSSLIQDELLENVKRFVEEVATEFFSAPEEPIIPDDANKTDGPEGKPETPNADKKDVKPVQKPETALERQRRLRKEAQDMIARTAYKKKK